MRKGTDATTEVIQMAIMTHRGLSLFVNRAWIGKATAMNWSREIVARVRTDDTIEVTAIITNQIKTNLIDVCQ